jgi:nucleoside-diphosphate-sugar epimerase
LISLVTGATGFIGRHLVAELAIQGVPVRALSRNEQRAPELLDGGQETIVGDCCDSQVMRRAVADVGVIYHCAAAHSTCSDDEIRRTNLPSVRCLFEAIHAAGARPRVILMSSINVLGNGSFADATEQAPRHHTNDLHVDQKIAAEELAERWIADRMEVVILRPGLVYGPGDPHLQKLARAIARGKFAFIGGRQSVVPLVHVSDMVQAMVLAAQVASPERVYHITDGSRTTIGELVDHLARVLECPAPKRVIPAVVPRLANSVCGLLGRNGPISPSALRFLGSSRHVDIQRARTQLRFEPRVQVAEGIESIRTSLREAVAMESAA